MYEDYERIADILKINSDIKDSDQIQQLLDEFQFSKYYAGLQKVIINCIEDYGESITSLFGVDSLLIFLK